jgi:hypothetical protein
MASVIIITSANTRDMKAAKDTLDNMITQRPLKQQNLCLDKGYDYLEIERESIKRRYLLHIRHREENKELIKHGKYYPKRKWACRKNQFLA